MDQNAVVRRTVARWRGNNWPAGTKTVILPYDRNHQEIAAEMKRMGIPDEAAVCPHDPRDPTGVSLLSITDPLMLAILEKILADDDAIKLMVVDTLTYASEKSLSKPEDMKAILDSIMTLAISMGWRSWCSSTRTRKAKRWAGGSASGPGCS